MVRKLDAFFMKDLQHGILKPLLEAVQNDDTLDLQIRDKCVHIYFRGGRLFEIKQSEGLYKVSSSDQAYNKEIEKEKLSYPRTVKTKHDAIAVYLDIPKLKIVMDRYLSLKKDSAERKKGGKEKEYQQLIVKENNYTKYVTKATDYFVCDMEYEEGPNRWDILAIQWESNSTKRKKEHAKDLKLAIIEVKYGDGALKDEKQSSGMIDHLRKTNISLTKHDSIKNLAKEMTDSFNQKLELGLVPQSECEHKITSIAATEKLDFIFVLINHDPDKSTLFEILNEIDPAKYPKLNIKFAVSNFMGYGLYKENIYTLEEFKAKFPEQILSIESRKKLERKQLK